MIKAWGFNEDTKYIKDIHNDDYDNDDNNDNKNNKKEYNNDKGITDLGQHRHLGFSQEHQ